MSLIYSIGALVSVGLMIYLAVALLKPEWYS
ncbi:MAG: K(+)-transporting ATPase subunit F [Planctomycetia bacterium]|nr:K(+)-transporting ATPase subunit F [Planctomycetia bacterium]